MYHNPSFEKTEKGSKKHQKVESDYFYCGSCRRGFPVAYTPEMIKSDTRPCPTCGAQSRLTPKLGEV